MGQELVLLIGTKKGAFIGQTDGSRRRWRLTGPHISGTWAILDLAYDRTSSTIYGGGASNWYGPAVWWTRDLGVTWNHSSEGLTYGDAGPAIEQVWRITPTEGAIYAGVEPAGLFRSRDGGRSWVHVLGLRDHPSVVEWRPTNGGLCLHSVWCHPRNARQMWAAVSSGGVFRTTDGGETWVRCALLAGGGEPHPCVHALAFTPHGPKAGDCVDGVSGGQLYQQNHDGVYRSDDGGGTWCDISAGLPSRFGFPLAVHPREPQTVYVVPLQGGAPSVRHVPDGHAAVWRTRDAGTHWERLTRGLPQGRTYLSVLRNALAVDPLAPAGVYFGTPTGHLFGSEDEGDSWFTIATALPPVYAVTCAVIENRERATSYREGDLVS